MGWLSSNLLFVVCVFCVHVSKNNWIGVWVDGVWPIQFFSRIFGLLMFSVADKVQWQTAAASHFLSKQLLPLDIASELQWQTAVTADFLSEQLPPLATADSLLQWRTTLALTCHFICVWYPDTTDTSANIYNRTLSLGIVQCRQK